MLKNKQPKVRESKWSLPPFVYIDAFLHPVSRESLKESLDKAQETIVKADQMSAEYKELSERVQSELAHTRNPQIG